MGLVRKVTKPAWWVLDQVGIKLSQLSTEVEVEAELDNY